jgi:hypothetical protein
MCWFSQVMRGAPQVPYEKGFNLLNAIQRRVGEQVRGGARPVSAHKSHISSHVPPGDRRSTALSRTTSKSTSSSSSLPRRPARAPPAPRPRRRGPAAAQERAAESDKDAFSEKVLETPRARIAPADQRTGPPPRAGLPRLRLQLPRIQQGNARRSRLGRVVHAAGAARPPNPPRPAPPRYKPDAHLPSAPYIPDVHLSSAPYKPDAHFSSAPYRSDAPRAGAPCG